jgi:hypothetical protein
MRVLSLLHARSREAISRSARQVSYHVTQAVQGLFLLQEQSCQHRASTKIRLVMCRILRFSHRQERTRELAARLVKSGDQTRHHERAFLYVS